MPDEKHRLAYERYQRRRLRHALREGVGSSSPAQSPEVLLGSPACVTDFSDPVDCAALDMAQTAISAIVTRHEVLRELVHRWDDHRRTRRKPPDKNTVAILRIAEAVEACASHYRVDHPSIQPSGRMAVERLRVILRAYFPTKVRDGRIPSVEWLEELIRNHADKSARGKHVTSGIVAAIVHHGGLLGGNRSERETLDLVSKVFRRHRPRKKKKNDGRGTSTD